MYQSIETPQLTSGTYRGLTTTTWPTGEVAWGGGGGPAHISLLPGPLSIGLAPEQAKQSRMLSENPALHRTTNCKTRLELVMLMSSASPMGIGPWAKQGNCKISGVKLTISPGDGGIQQDKVSGFKSFSIKKSCCNLRSWHNNMSPLTVKKDHESTRGAN